MIKRVWIKQNNNWLHITPEQFSKQNKKHNFQNPFDYQEKLFKPNDIFTIQNLYNNLIKLDNNKNIEESHRDAIFFIKEIFTPYYQSEYELSKLGFFPKQIETILTMYKNNNWKSEIEKIENKEFQ